MQCEFITSITTSAGQAANDTIMSLVRLCRDGPLGSSTLDPWRGMFDEEGIFKGVKAALQRGDDVNTKDEHGDTGLIWASVWNHNSVIALFLSTPNIDVNQQNNQGRCSLHFAAKDEQNTKNNEALKLLLNTPSIDVNIVDKRGRSAVYWAVDGDNIECLKLLLSHPSLTAPTLNMKTKYYGYGDYGYTPVMLAVRMNRLKHLELLVADPRVDLDTIDKEGRSLEEVARWLFLLHSCLLILSTMFIGHHHHLSVASGIPPVKAEMCSIFFVNLSDQ